MSKRVFIVDDSKAVLFTLRATLEKEGFQVFEADDGKSAQKKLSCQEVDLLITDFNMPNMNGIELAAHVRQMPRMRFLPIVMMTTDTNKDNINLGKAIGISTWLNKSCHMERLPKLVHLLVGA